MKYKILEKPNCEEAYDLVKEGLCKKAMITLFSCCKIIYEGRALSQLDFGERLIIIKPDGSFLVHQEKKVEPVNWQPPKSRTKVNVHDNELFLESYRRTPKERLEVEVKKTLFASYSVAKDYAEIELAGYEKDMGDMIMKKPYLIEEGFKPTAREYSTEHVFIDILGKDYDGNLMVLELKARKAGTNAVKQIKRYLSDFENPENDYLKDLGAEKQKIRGLLVAPSINEDAKELSEKEGIEFVSVTPPKELKNDKKVTLDIFK